MAKAESIEGASSNIGYAQQGRLIGYARVSTNAQDTRLQMDALDRAGVSEVVQEKAGGGDLARPALQALLKRMGPGDTLVVYKIDRLARSLLDLLSVIRGLKASGVALRSLTEPIDTGSALGELVLQLLGAIAQFELALIRERVRAGRAAAKERGVIFGAKRLFDYERAAELKASGLSWREVGEAMGENHHSIRNALGRVKRRGVPIRDPRQGGRA